MYIGNRSTIYRQTVTMVVPTYLVGNRQFLFKLLFSTTLLTLYTILPQPNLCKFQKFSNWETAMK